MYLNITATAGCRGTCLYCPQDLFQQAMRGHPRHLSRAEFLSLLPNLRETHFAAVSFGGFSEPLDNPEIVSLLRLTREQLSVDALWVYTNGENLTPEIVRELEPARVDLLDVSCHGFDADVYRRTRSFIDPEKVRANVLSLLEHHTHIGHVTISVTGPFGSDADLCELQQRCEASGARFERRSLHSRAGLLQIGRGERKSAGPFRCAKFDFEKPVLLPGGDLALCCQDFGLEQIIGNLHEQPFARILETSPLRRRVLNVARGLEQQPELRCYDCVFCVPLGPPLPDVLKQELRGQE
jgi:hypothetical protein